MHGVSTPHIHGRLSVNDEAENNKTFQGGLGLLGSMGCGVFLQSS